MVKMAVSKTKLFERAKRKTDFGLRNLIIKLKASNSEFWLNVASLLARPRRKAIKVNLEKINKETKADDVVVVPGKVLGKGYLDKPITLACLAISQKARKEVEKNSRLIGIAELYQQNKEGKGIKLIK
jgi:large subunit ribosomal protein L18e